MEKILITHRGLFIFIPLGPLCVYACTAFILQRDQLTFAEQSYAAGGVATGLIRFELER